MASLPLKEGAVVADIGAGGGFYTLEIARRIGPKGRVIAVDVDEKALRYIGSRAKKADLDNIGTILSDGGPPSLAPGSVDLVFMRDVCHHIKDPVAFFKGLKGAIKTTGEIAMIDYDGTGRSVFHGPSGHHIRKEDLVGWMRSAGYRQLRSHDFLPGQLFMLFAVE